MASDNAAIYITVSGNENTFIFSFTINKNNTAQLNHNAGFIIFLDVFFVERATAIKEIIKKIKSKFFHQIGLDSHPPAAQECAIKINGVARQCITHNVLATAPKTSDFSKTNLTVLFINATELQK